MSRKEIFLIDSNAFMTPYSAYYPFDFAPNFWKQLEKHIHNGSIIIIDKVKAEVLNGNDPLSDWIKKFKAIDTKPYFQHYSDVLESVNQNPCYKPNALHEWSKETVADAWLIATAKEYDYTIITLEKPGNPDKNQPSKEAKIPDVAKEFDVKTEDLFYLMRKLKFKL